MKAKKIQADAETSELIGHATVILYSSGMVDYEFASESQLMLLGAIEQLKKRIMEKEE